MPYTEQQAGTAIRELLREQAQRRRLNPHQIERQRLLAAEAQRRDQALNLALDILTEYQQQHAQGPAAPPVVTALGHLPDLFSQPQ